LIPGLAGTGETGEFSGVISDRCYGCGRCLPVCPIHHISTRSHQLPVEAIAPLVLQSGVDALEIHTQVGRVAEFQRLWRVIAPWVGRLKLVAVSCPDGDGLVDYLRSLYAVMNPRPAVLLWQTDGRPMSGDIGNGTTHAAIKLGQKVLAANLPGYVQLAGGTNSYTVPKLRSLGLLRPGLAEGDGDRHTQRIAGVAYGSYARVLLTPVLEQLEQLEQIERRERLDSSELSVSELSVSELPASELSKTEPLATEFLPPLPQNLGNESPIRSTTGTVTTSTLNHSPHRLKPRSDQLETHPDLLWKSVQMSYDLIAPLKYSSPV